MTNLTDRLYEYLEIRRALGYDLAFKERVMKKFTAYADERHANTSRLLSSRHGSVTMVPQTPTLGLPGCLWSESLPHGCTG